MDAPAAYDPGVPTTGVKARWRAADPASASLIPGLVGRGQVKATGAGARRPSPDPLRAACRSDAATTR
jgi:hypothetical protein